MATVREASLDLLRAHGMTTIFGNPGSTELPMLTEFPDDFTYVLGLQELGVMGMADGYAQASGRVTHVNLHTAPGVGNAIGGIFNAQTNRAPLLITVGQQARPQVTIEANLTNRDPIVGPMPYVKYAHEPARAQDVPTALGRAIHHAGMPPRGPALVSIPMDDWAVEADADRAGQAAARVVHSRSAPDPSQLAALAQRLSEARSPMLVCGPDVDASGAWDAAIALAEAQRLEVWAPPATGGSRLGFPEDHPQFAGILAPAIGPLSQMLEGHDLVLVVGSSVFAYYPYLAGPLLPDGTSLVMLTADSTDAARAPMGEAILGDVGLGLRALAELCGAADASRSLADPRGEPAAPSAAPEGSDRLSGSHALASLRSVWPDDGICVVEAPSSTLAIRNRLRLSRPGSYYFCASGGLGWGMGAAIGVQLAQPDRPVVCVLGEGSAQYAIQSLWTAVAYRVPVTFLVLRNDEYSILKWFGMLENVSGVPGLDLPGLDVAAVARGYGVDAVEVAAGSSEALAEALRDAIADRARPRLVQVPIAPGMWGD
jgi:benzoylformate decarboxylase